jgi:DNA-binding transcriptional ArsR family regulator
MLSPAHQQFLKTLSNTGRMELMLLLLKKSMNVGDLVEKSGLEQSAVSHHLKRLKLCGFVTVETKGKERVYSVNEETVGPLFRLMNTHVKKYCFKLCCKKSPPSSHDR